MLIRIFKTVVFLSSKRPVARRFFPAFFAVQRMPSVVVTLRGTTKARQWTMNGFPGSNRFAVTARYREGVTAFELLFPILPLDKVYGKIPAFS